MWAWHSSSFDQNVNTIGDSTLCRFLMALNVDLTPPVPGRFYGYRLDHLRQVYRTTIPPVKAPKSFKDVDVPPFVVYLKCDEYGRSR